MDELSLAAALLVVAVLGILIVCGAMTAWNWFAVRMFDRLFGAMETAIRWIATRR